MKQITVKRAVEAWYWIHNNEHHSVYLEWPKSMSYHEQKPENASHITLANHFEKLRIPDALRKEVWDQVRPNARKFDKRMYALKPKARAVVENGLR